MKRRGNKANAQGEIAGRRCHAAEEAAGRDDSIQVARVRALVAGKVNVGLCEPCVDSGGVFRYAVLNYKAGIVRSIGIALEL